MATKVKFTCLPRKTVPICRDMLEDERFQKHPKLFHIWAVLHEYKQTSYGALAQKVGCSKDVIKKHIKKMKELNLIEETNLNEYTVQLSTWGAFAPKCLDNVSAHEYIPIKDRKPHPESKDKAKFVRECTAYNKIHGETEIPF